MTRTKVLSLARIIHGPTVALREDPHAADYQDQEAKSLLIKERDRLRDLLSSPSLQYTSERVLAAAIMYHNDPSPPHLSYLRDSTAHHLTYLNTYNEWKRVRDLLSFYFVHSHRWVLGTQHGLGFHRITGANTLDDLYLLLVEEQAKRRTT